MSKPKPCVDGVRLRATSLGALASILWLSGALSAAAYTAADLQPLALGNSWTYVEGGGQSTYTVVETRMMAGVETLIVEGQSGPGLGFQTALTNDENGLRIHETVAPDPDGGIQSFAPPATQLEAMFSAPSDFSESGSTEVTVTGLGVFAGTYETDVSVVGLEMVTVPAGVFEALRVDTTLVATFLVMGSPVEISSLSSDWYVSGVGYVRSEGIVDGEAFLSELVSTNVPEPGLFMLQAAALLTVGMVERLRSASAA